MNILDFVIINLFYFIGIVIDRVGIGEVDMDDQNLKVDLIFLIRINYQNINYVLLFCRELVGLYNVVFF